MTTLNTILLIQVGVFIGFGLVELVSDGWRHSVGSFAAATALALIAAL